MVQRWKDCSETVKKRCHDESQCDTATTTECNSHPAPRPLHATAKVCNNLSACVPEPCCAKAIVLHNHNVPQPERTTATIRYNHERCLTMRAVRGTGQRCRCAGAARKREASIRSSTHGNDAVVEARKQGRKTNLKRLRNARRK